jgi:hypothetical protein
MFRLVTIASPLGNVDWTMLETTVERPLEASPATRFPQLATAQPVEKRPFSATCSTEMRVRRDFIGCSLQFFVGLRRIQFFGKANFDTKLS